AFKEKWTFPNLLKVIDKQVKKSGRVPRSAKLGRLALSAWSAGYGSVSAILRVPTNAKRVDAVLLADGLHSDFVGRTHPKVDDGTGVKDHINHIWAMNETMLPYLRARWSGAE